MKIANIVTSNTIEKIDDINQFFRQGINEQCDYQKSVKELSDIMTKETIKNEEIPVPARANPQAQRAL